MSHHTELGRHDSGTLSSLDLKIFIKDVHDKNGRKRPLTVRPWATVKDVKDLLCKHLHVPPSAQCIYYGPLLTSAKELPNHRTLQDAGIYRSGETLLLEIKGAAAAGSSSHSISSLRSKANDICVSSSLLDLTPQSLQRLIQQARRGLALGFKPALAADGSGGSYFLSDARKMRVGVFKPADEEPFAENNPRGYVPQGVGDCLRQGIRPGELCLREVAAFILDHEGFSGVPMTTLAEARHPALHVNGAKWTLSEGGASVGIHSLNSPSTANELVKKVGSFQEYVNAECSMDDLSPSKISVDEVHKIAILDIRIMNADRNVANILCQRIPEDPDQFRLVPIDHGYSLRSVCDVAWFDWCWLDWPQTKQPLSKKSKDYILNLDIEADVRLLQERLNMQNDVLDYFRASCNVLKAGVRAGLTLYDIASEILCRNDPSGKYLSGFKPCFSIILLFSATARRAYLFVSFLRLGEIPSKLETLTTMASELAMSAVHNGRFHHATASLALEEQLASMSGYERSTKFPNLSMKSRTVVRSVSSSLFSQVQSMSSNGGESAFTDELFDSQNSKNPPGMVQSSQSDNSSDEGSFTTSGPEDCEAEEWAAALVAVADESLDKDAIFCRNRSVSDSSSSTDYSGKLSSSPVGFWYVRPGSSSLDDASDDDEPICWTPSLTSSNPPGAIVNDVGPPHVLSPSGFSTSNLSKLLNDSRNGFELDDVSRLNENDKFTTPVAPVEPTGNFSFLQTENKKIVRSMSYTAFSSYSDENAKQSKLFKSTAIRNSLSSKQENDLFRTYFMKFVDLLVVRETERLLHSRAS